MAIGAPNITLGNFAHDFLSREAGAYEPGNGAILARPVIKLQDDNISLPTIYTGMLPQVLGHKLMVSPDRFLFLSRCFGDVCLFMFFVVGAFVSFLAFAAMRLELP